MEHDQAGKVQPAAYYLASVPTSVEVSQLLRQPALSALAAEDVCWNLALEDWRARTPRRWQRRKLRAWVVEGHALFAEQARLQDLAHACGVGD